jgi:peptide-methionine (S)-S-oxide reductase
MEKATFGAGCFWGSEEAFSKLDGVLDTQVGMMSGAEVVDISFDPAQISYAELLSAFWQAHDPTQLNRQGPDIGPEYRSVIFAHSDQQRQAALHAKDALVAQKPVVTEVVDATNLHRAAEHHQQYNEKRGLSTKT